jgi:hypothetical protein
MMIMVVVVVRLLFVLFLLGRGGPGSGLWTR